MGPYFSQMLNHNPELTNSTAFGLYTALPIHCYSSHCKIRIGKNLIDICSYKLLLSNELCQIVYSVVERLVAISK